MRKSRYQSFTFKASWCDPQGNEHDIVITGTISPEDKGDSYTPPTPAGVEDYEVMTSDGIEIEDDDGKILAEFEDNILEQELCDPREP